MSFDASRFPFDPWKDFAGVVMEQGRVQLDSDWNEWLAILNRRIQAGTLDTVGRAVYPATTPYGFKIGARAGCITLRSVQDECTCTGCWRKTTDRRRRRSGTRRLPNCRAPRRPRRRHRKRI